MRKNTMDRTIGLSLLLSTRQKLLDKNLTYLPLEIKIREIQNNHSSSRLSLDEILTLIDKATTQESYVTHK